MLHGLYGGAGLLAVLNLLLLLYVLYDILIREKMVVLEKIIWAALAVFTGLIGMLLYLYFVMHRGDRIADHVDM